MHVIEMRLPGVEFVQDNHSRSTRGVLRGMHLQWRRPQGKLVRCSRGRIFDIADVSYKRADYHDPGGEAGLRWDDGDVGIEWPIDAPDLSVNPGHPVC